MAPCGVLWVEWMTKTSIWPSPLLLSWREQWWWWKVVATQLYYCCCSFNRSFAYCRFVRCAWDKRLSEISAFHSNIMHNSNMMRLCSASFEYFRRALYSTFVLYSCCILDGGGAEVNLTVVMIVSFELLTIRFLNDQYYF